MKQKLSILLVLLIALASFGCGGKHPADHVATVIVPATEVYFGVQESLIGLHDAGAPTVVNNWQSISDTRHKASKAYRKSWKAWQDLSRINNPQNVQQMNQSLASLASLVSTLLSFIPQDDPARPTLDAGMMRLKEAANGVR